jgi:hypothetical protein
MIESEFFLYSYRGLVLSKPISVNKGLPALDEALSLHNIDQIMPMSQECSVKEFPS